MAATERSQRGFCFQSCLVHSHLFVYQDPIGGLRNRLATIIGNGRDIRNNATLATAILALKCGEMIHPFEVLR